MTGPIADEDGAPIFDGPAPVAQPLPPRTPLEVATEERQAAILAEQAASLSERGRHAGRWRRRMGGHTVRVTRPPLN